MSWPANLEGLVKNKNKNEKNRANLTQIKILKRTFSAIISNYFADNDMWVHVSKRYTNTHITNVPSIQVISCVYIGSLFGHTNHAYVHG